MSFPRSPTAIHEPAATLAAAGRSRRPVVVGIGAVTAYGWGEKYLRDGLFSGQSAVAPVPAPHPGPGRETDWMAVVDDEGEAADGPDRLDRAARYAGREAVADALERGWRPGSSVGLVHAVAEDGAGSARTVVPRITRDLSLGGPSMTVTGGPTAGLAALLTAGLWIRAGMADDVLVVATDLSASLGERGAAGGEGLLHTEAPARVVCRPFQEGSVGPNPGEASVAMVVSGSTGDGYGALAGWAMAHRTDGSRASPPDRTQLEAQLEQTVFAALAAAGVDASAVAYLNAHGSGRPESDAVEATVLDDALPGAAGVYSLKPLVGDCRVASGPLELVGALYGFTTGVIPAPLRAAKGHPRLLDGPTAAMDGAVAKISLGTDGDLAALIVRPVP